MTSSPETTRITIVVPGCPDRLLAPNRRTYGKRKAEPTRQHRGDAKYSGMEQGAGITFIGPVAVAALVRWGKGEVVHDLDSVAVMVKPYIDGLVDAGLMINDSQMKRLIVEQEPYRTSKILGGDVVLTIETIREDAA